MNVKPGDLAIVVRTISGKHIGAIVTVEKSIPEFTFPDGVNYGPLWEVRWSRKFEFFGGGFGHLAWVPDAWLRPVSGLPDTEHTDEREPIKEMA